MRIDHVEAGVVGVDVVGVQNFHVVQLLLFKSLWTRALNKVPETIKNNNNLINNSYETFKRTRC